MAYEHQTSIPTVLEAKVMVQIHSVFGEATLLGSYVEGSRELWGGGLFYKSIKPISEASMPLTQAPPKGPIS